MKQRQITGGTLQKNFSAVFVINLRAVQTLISSEDKDLSLIFVDYVCILEPGVA